MENTKNFATSNSLRDKEADLELVRRTRKVFWRYWLYDRICRIAISLVFGAYFVITEFFYTLENSIISLEIYLPGLIIIFLVDNFWLSFLNQEISLTRYTDVYTDLQRYPKNRRYVGPSCCLIRAILQTYYPVSIWTKAILIPAIGISAVGLYSYWIGAPISIVLLISSEIIGFGVCLLTGIIVRRWLKPAIERLADR